MTTNNSMTSSVWTVIKRYRLLLGFLAVMMVCLSLVAAQLYPGKSVAQENFPTPDKDELTATTESEPEVATFGSGCFWCTEAVFAQLKGVQKVESGYSGGSVQNPTYEQVCTGSSGHAEVIQITFDPKVVSYPELLEVFWRTHDPTTKNRQGNDVGRQYRSVIFYHSERQQQLAEQYRQKIDAAQVFSSPLVTEISPFTTFYPAETYHQNYYANHASAPYCRLIIGPKIEKLRHVFHEKLKSE
jgi:peptide-methionine (S)-S-oxide reductase